VSHESTQAIAKYDAEGRDVLGMVQLMVVDTVERYEAAADVLVDIKTIRKEIKTEKDAIVKPLRASLEATNELFDRIDSRYEQAEAELKRRLAQYADAAKAEEVRLLAEAATSETHDLALVSYAAPVAPGVQTRTKKVVHIFNEGLVPDEYWVVDEKAVGKAARAGVIIPGVEVKEETIIAAGTR